MEMQGLPLSGIKVVELGTYVVVPNVARIMAQWGAEVVKVESPEGELWRYSGPRQGVPGEENALYNVQNANKQFVALNLKKPGAMDVMHRLLAEADVFVTNVRMGGLARMGLDYDSLKEKYPRLVYAHFSGYGTKGPHGHWPGFDYTAFWARSGAMRDFVNKGDAPLRPATGFGDSTVASILLSGVLAALLGRQSTGRGTMVSSSLYGSAIWYCSTGVISGQPQYRGDVYPLDYMDLPDQPANLPFECKDGKWVFFSYAGYDKNYKKMCAMLGLEAYAEDERFSTVKVVVKEENMRAYMKVMRARFLQKTSAEWSKIFQQHDVIHEVLAHMADIHKDEQAWANGFLKDHTFENGVRVAMPNVPVQFADVDVNERFDTVGGVGRDTAEVLARLGLGEKEQQALQEEGALG